MLVERWQRLAIQQRQDWILQVGQVDLSDFALCQRQRISCSSGIQCHTCMGPITTRPNALEKMTGLIWTTILKDLYFYFMLNSEIDKWRAGAWLVIILSVSYTKWKILNNYKTFIDMLSINFVKPINSKMRKFIKTITSKILNYDQIYRYTIDIQYSRDQF